MGVNLHNSGGTQSCNVKGPASKSSDWRVDIGNGWLYLNPARVVCRKEAIACHIFLDLINFSEI